MRVQNFDALKIATICVEELSKASSSKEFQARCKRVSGALRARNVRLANEFSLGEPQVDHEASDVFFDAQLRAFVSKLEGNGYDPARTATARWFTAEWRCKWVNRRIQAWHKRTHKVRPYAREIDRMRQFIIAAIGESPNVDEMLDLCKFGPGTSVGVSGDATHFFAKLKGEWSVTPTCIPYAVAALGRVAGVWEMLGLARDGVRCVDPEGFAAAARARCVWSEKHDEVMMVPKNAKTHRFIGKPKTLDGFVQLGVGEFIARRLRRFGVDLRCQNRNQELAKAGSSLEGYTPYHGTWSTIDLEMASDTISREVVRLLLPPEWFSFLCRMRSPTYKLVDFPDMGVLNYEKFSAMGNGFTFPLETLIFMAVCHAAGDGLPCDCFSVYGDDIAIRSSYALRLIELLRFLGFRVNNEKSFLFGKFKESCGSDFVDGINVRPAYLKGDRLNQLNLIGLHNRVLLSPFVSLTYLCDRLRKVGVGIPTKPVNHVHLGGAFMVPYDKWIRSKDTRWCNDLQRPLWRELLPISVLDKDSPEGLPPGAVLDGALVGGTAREGIPLFAYRRRFKLVCRTMGADAPSDVWVDPEHQHG